MPMVAEGQEAFAVTLEGETETKTLYTNDKGLLIGAVPPDPVWMMGEEALTADELKAMVFEADTVLTAGYTEGDLDGDRVLTVADATLLMQFLVGYDVSFAGDADLNSDGRVTIYDVVCLLRMLNE